MPKAGRPKGSGYKDGKYLDLIADALTRDPDMTPNEAIMKIAFKQSNETSPEAFRRRMHRKWRAQESERLAEAQERRREKYNIQGRALAARQAERMAGVAEQVSLALATDHRMDFAGAAERASLALAGLRHVGDGIEMSTFGAAERASLAVVGLRNIGDGLDMPRMDSALEAARAALEPLQSVRAAMDSVKMPAVQELQISHTARVMRDLQNSLPAFKIK